MNQTPRTSHTHQRPSARHANPAPATQERRRASRANQPAQSKPRRKYVASIDALRTLAVFAVMGYHLSLPFDKGGLIGVTIFFVISGYLITGLLVNEIHKTGTINLLNFWFRRIRRLFPAIFCVVAITLLLCVLFNHQLLTKARPDVVPSLFWFQNWWYIIRDISYFENLGSPSPLVHFWSLAIEEQFYLIWPLLLLGIYKLGGKNAFVRRLCLGLGLASAIAMMVLYNPQADPTRVYYGTDTRAFSLLIGAWLAIAWPWKRFDWGLDFARRADNANRSPEGSIPIFNFITVGTLDIAATVSIAGLLAIMALVDGMSPAMYYGIMLLVSILSAIVIMAIVVPESRVARVMEFKPLCWIGMRSYGMYLWHYPIILLLRPLGALPDGTYTWWFVLLAIALTIGVSALQYKFVEDPIRNGWLGPAARKLASTAKQRSLSLAQKIALGVCGVLSVVVIVGCVAIPDEGFAPEGAITSTGVGVDQAMNITATVPAETTTEMTDEQKLASHYVNGMCSPILIGDSVPAALYDYDSFYIYGFNDSVVSRWTFQATSVLQQYIDRGVVGECVIVGCFTNHSLNDGELDQLLQTVGSDRKLFLITCKIPNAGILGNNDDIRAFANAHSNVYIIDWYSASIDHPEYFWDDETHLTPEGSAAYLALIDSVVRPHLDQFAAGTTSVYDVLEVPDTNGYSPIQYLRDLYYAGTKGTLPTF